MVIVSKLKRCIELNFPGKNSSNLKPRRKEMQKFDPWPLFFKREWNRNWPFLVGFAITGAIITKFSLGLTEEDAKNSPFVQRHKR